MLLSALHRLYAPLAYFYSRSRLDSTGKLPLPTGTPIAHAAGPDPDRILLLGGGAVQGMGVASHDLGLPGHLARSLATLSHHGADVEAQGFERFAARDAAKVLRDADLARFDAVVLQVGGRELLEFQPIAAWKADISAAIAAAERSAPSGTPVLILGTLPLFDLMDVPRWIRRMQSRRLSAMNAVTRRACEASASAIFVELRNDGTPQRTDDQTHSLYEEWAWDIAPALVVSLASLAPKPTPPVDETARQRALDGLGLTREADVRTERIVRMARDAFGVESAMLTLIDHDVQWVKATAGSAGTGNRHGDVPRSDSICDLAIRTPGLFVVEDIAADCAFGQFSWTGTDEAPGFYAGYPLEAPGGQRIGALCVLDASPRSFTRDDEAMLRSLALRAQAVLWDSAS